jgi:hypothetical protein
MHSCLVLSGVRLARRFTGKFGPALMYFHREEVSRLTAVSFFRVANQFLWCIVWWFSRPIKCRNGSWWCPAGLLRTLNKATEVFNLISRLTALIGPDGLQPITKVCRIKKVYNTKTLVLCTSTLTMEAA